MTECKHHEAHGQRIEANEKRIGRVERGLLWIYSLLILNLGTCFTMLVIKFIEMKATPVA